MRFSRSLRFRVAAAFAAVGGGVSLVIAVGLYLGTRAAGERLIDETLTAEMQDYPARRARNPHSPPPATVTLLGYLAPAGPRDPPLPDALVGQPPGRRHIWLGGLPYRLAVADRGCATSCSTTRPCSRSRRSISPGSWRPSSPSWFWSRSASPCGWRSG